MSGVKPQVTAAIYLRISSDPTGQQLGVARQREDCLALCNNRGWVPVEYLDNDVSASSGKRRPAYERMLTDIREGRIGAVVCWHLDRLHRQPIELEHFMQLADAGQVKLATVTGDVDLSTDDGQFMARIMGAVARKEVDRKRARQLRAAQQKAERGEPQWRNAFGYMTDGSRVPDPTTAPLVQRVYAHVLAGGSLMDGVRMLNAAGAYGRWNKPWTASTLSLFLRKPRNAGLRAYKGEIVGRGTWPALVDESMWQATQAILNAPGRGPGKKSVRKHLLTGVLKCGKNGCGGTLAGHWVMQSTGGKSGRRPVGVVFESNGQTAHRIVYACKTCFGCSIRAGYVEPLIYKTVARRLARADAVDLLRSAQFDPAEAKRLADEKQALYAQIRAAEAEYDDGMIDGRRLASRRERVAEKLADIDRLQQDSERLRVFDGLPLGTPEVADKVTALSPDRLRAVMDVLMTVTVLPVGKGHRVNGDRYDPGRVVVEWI